MRGAEDPADQLPAQTPVVTGFELFTDAHSYYVIRRRNGLVSYRLAFNNPFDAVEAYQLATRR